MILKRILNPNSLQKVRQLELLCSTNLFANSCRPPQLGRTSATLANTKQCFKRNVSANSPASVTLNSQIIRETSGAAGDHVRLWIYEKIAAAALPIIIPAALMLENQITDVIMSIAVVIHAHWGLEAIITDYARPIVVGNALPKILHLSLLILSGVTLAGLFILVSNGPGVSRAIKDAWAIGSKPSSATK